MRQLATRNDTAGRRPARGRWLTVKVLLPVLLLMTAIGACSHEPVALAGQQAEPLPARQLSAPGEDPAPVIAIAAPLTAAQPRAMRWGVTVDTLDHLAATVAAVAELPVAPVVRLIFDLDEEPSAYRNAVARLSEHSEVMALVVDSSGFAELTVKEYLARFQTYVTLFGDEIDLWEIGNEVNGEWLGRSSDVVEAITGAERIVRARDLTPVLTLYYNPDCAEDPAHDMFTWAGRQLSSQFRSSLPYVLLSYYPDQCGNFWPDQTMWEQTFDRVGSLFPNALSGIGEIGISDGVGSSATKVKLVNRCYGLRIKSDRYLGGCFWWYFAEDAVPHVGNPVWNAIAQNMQDR